MSDFSDRQFHVGSLVGLRAFSVDSLGRLTGPAQGGIFTPGVNEAECKASKTNDPYLRALMAHTTAIEAQLRGMEAISKGRSKKERRSLATSAVAPREAIKPQHTLSGLGCKCGFYAYFDGMNDYMMTGRVAAVVEGFGVYTLGTRGFRTSKARLLALIVPPMGTTENYSSLWVTTFGGTTPERESMTPLLWSYVQRNYSDVPVFASKDDALAEHPLYEPEVPTPETAEDFWTRSAS